MNDVNALHHHAVQFADWGWVSALLALGGTMVPGISLALQWSLAVAGITAAICSARYHYKAAKKL